MWRTGRPRTSSEAPIATPTPALLRVLDDAVPPELHAAGWTACTGARWAFGHGSVAERTRPFWKLDLDGDATFDAIWAALRPSCEQLAGAPLRVLRQYANGHTYGLGGEVHRDDVRPGTYTLVWFPMPAWPTAWEGETVFYDPREEVAKTVRPRPNRAILFDARIPHVGRPPARGCVELRVTVAFKLATDAALAGPATGSTAGS